MKLTYLITGASQGIGFEITKNLIKKKFNLILCSRNIKNLTKSLSSNNSLKLIKSDLTKVNDIKKIENYLKKNKIKLNGIILCHGMLGEPINVYDDKFQKKWLKIFNTNFTSNKILLNKIFKFIKKNSFSKIIFFSGGGVFTTWPKFSAYSVSKTALIKYMENLASEAFNKKIIVSAVAPGFLNTSIHKNNYKILEKLNDKYRNELKINANKKPDFSNIIGLLNFLIFNNKMIISGKTISANYDKWKNKNFTKILGKNKNYLMITRNNIN